MARHLETRTRQIRPHPMMTEDDVARVFTLLLC
jgi:hypothetical protein